MINNSALFDLLTDDARRRVLLTMCDAEEIRVPDEVREPGTGAAAVAHSEGAPTAGRGPPDSEAVRLHHVHLPKLADAGLVDWDPETGTVTPGPAFGAAEPALRLLATNGHLLPDGRF